MRKQTRTEDQQASSGEPTLADRIKRKRKREGLSQGQAARAWGIKKETLQTWEQNRHAPRGIGLLALEKLLQDKE